MATPSFAAAFDRDLDLWEGLSTLVLDEADMLLDGGFKKQLDRCLVALKRVERRREGNDDLVEDVPERCRRVVVQRSELQRTKEIVYAGADGLGAKAVAAAAPRPYTLARAGARASRKGSHRG